MTQIVELPYFTPRGRRSWRMLGYSALAFLFLRSLKATWPITSIALALFIVPAIWNLVLSFRERNGDKIPKLIAHQKWQEERRDLSHVTFRHLFATWKSQLSISDVITEAGKCSNDFGRRLCIVYLRAECLSINMRENLIMFLRQRVRSNDDVTIISDNEFIVCAPLLSDTLAAEIIYKRLAEAIQSSVFPYITWEIRLGKAIYPMDGYSGEELIQRARIGARALGSIFASDPDG